VSPRQTRRKVRKGNSFFTPLVRHILPVIGHHEQDELGAKLSVGRETGFVIPSGDKAASANLYTVSTVCLCFIEGLVGTFDE
jgi:hypothetical protein